MTTGYVTLDESQYLNMLYGQRGDFDPAAYNTAFTAAPIPAGTLPPFGYSRLADRPSYPPYSKLWGRYVYPLTPWGLLLWQDGTVKAVQSFYDSDYLSCDDRILGGHKWVVPEDSWQAQVMRDAGYPLIECEPLP